MFTDLLGGHQTPERPGLSGAGRVEWGREAAHFEGGGWMGERRWLKSDENGEFLIPWFPDEPELGITDAEVLAEMPTEALIEELRRRGFQPDAQSGGWSTVVAKGAGDG